MSLPGVRLCHQPHPTLRVSCGLPQGHAGAHGDPEGEVWWQNPAEEPRPTDDTRTRVSDLRARLYTRAAHIATDVARHALVGVQLGAVLASGVGGLIFIGAWLTHDAANICLDALARSMAERLSREASLPASR